MLRRLLTVLLAAAGVAALIGALLWSWGWDDLQGYFAHPARSAVVALFVVGVHALIVMTLLGHGVGAVLQRPKQRRDDPWWFWLVLAAAVATVFWLGPYGDRRGAAVLPESDAVRYAGLVLFLAGAAVRLTARVTLGARHLPVVGEIEGHQLQTQGIYRFVRNPSYLGGIVATLGLALIFRSGAGVIAAVAVAAALRARLVREEAFLAERFGDEWREYAARVPRFMPRFRR